MQLARVAGTVVATKKEPTMEGLKLLVLTPVDASGTDRGAPVVAVDAVGAGVGEMVLFATGSSARQTRTTENRPCDAVIMAIVDSWEVGGTQQYKK